MGLAQANETQKVELFWRTNWDFFSGGDGAKTGYITDLKESGCTLKTSEPIEFRRWIRMLIRDAHTNVSFTAIGRVVRCENSFEASIGSEVTLYRYKVEFTYPVDVSLLSPNAPGLAREPRQGSVFASRPRPAATWVSGTESSAPTSA